MMLDHSCHYGHGLVLLQQKIHNWYTKKRILTGCLTPKVVETTITANPSPILRSAVWNFGGVKQTRSISSGLTEVEDSSMNALGTHRCTHWAFQCSFEISGTSMIWIITGRWTVMRGALANPHRSMKTSTSLFHTSRHKWSLRTPVYGSFWAVSG